MNEKADTFLCRLFLFQSLSFFILLINFLVFFRKNIAHVLSKITYQQRKRYEFFVLPNCVAKISRPKFIPYPSGTIYGKHPSHHRAAHMQHRAT